MNILIIGANTYNKGAQLMLLALSESIKSHIPNATIYVSPLVISYEYANKLGIKTLNYPLFHYGNKAYFKLSIYIPILVRLALKVKGVKLKGDISLNKINMVMDISGFAFGDKWGSRPLRDLAMFAKKIKKQNTLFVMMPQALGPFFKPNMVRYMNKVFKYSDLVIARDNESYNYTKSILKDTKLSGKLVQFPDITLTFHQDKTVTDDNSANNYCSIVPNEMMIKKGSKEWQDEYVNVMNKIISIILKNSDLKIVILIHTQGTGDAELGEAILKKMQKREIDRVMLVNESDPIKLKQFISSSTFVIGSRFHALASALSTNVPAISTSWLHKYEMLFKEYECDDLNFNKPNDLIFAKTKELLDLETRVSYSNKLKAANKKIVKKSEAMWSVILEKAELLKLKS